MTNNFSLYDLLNNPDLSPQKKIDTYNDYIMYSTMRQRSPLSCVLELTPVCNFNCEVCYIRRTLEEVVRCGNHVMSFDEWKYYIDGFCDLNVYYFTLTGGECTLHPDFISIYEYLYNKGRSITIMTNGSALNDEIFSMFKKMPPRKVVITVYGSSEDTYEKFCQNRGAYTKVTKNIEKLLSINIRPIINYTCGKDNIDDLFPTYKYINELGLPFTPVWNLISFGLCDDRKISTYGITADAFNEGKKRIFENSTDDTYINQLVFSKVKRNSEVKETGISCNAARNTCAINWRGRMVPCIAFDAFCVDPHDVGGIKECWKELVKWADDVPLLVECQQCIFRNRCFKCIARHYNDTHEFGKVSPRLCFKVQHPEEAAKLQAEYDRRQAEKAAQDTDNTTVQGE